jgi:hypothetical protein
MPKPSNDGDGKLRVLASSEKPWIDSPKDPKIAGLLKPDLPPSMWQRVKPLGGNQ